MEPAPRRNLDLDTAVADVETRYAEANPKSAAHHAESCQALPGGNTRTILFYDPFPLTLTGGEGAVVRDLDGHEYVDYLGEYTAALYGHSNPVIQEAVERALRDGVVLGGPNRYEARLAELMCDRFPALERVRFCNSGTEANMMLFSLARAVTGRDAIMVFRGAYHGGLLHFGHPDMPMNAPYRTITGEFNDVEGTRDLIAAHAGELAAVVVEPVMGTAGCIPGTSEFLQTLRDETSRHGIILIFDEVMTSRLAPGGMQERLGIRPDVASFGKYLGGGVTFGAFGGRADLMDRLDPRRPDALLHSGTYNNNVLTMAAGAAGLEHVLTAEAIQRLNASGDALRTRLTVAAEAAGAPVTVTGLGSMVCLHLQREPITRPADKTADRPQARKLLHLDMLLRGFYVSRLGMISLSLPMTEAYHDAFVGAFETFLSDYGALLED